jgi:hypothetical protein
VKKFDGIYEKIEIKVEIYGNFCGFLGVRGMGIVIDAFQLVEFYCPTVFPRIITAVV